MWNKKKFKNTVNKFTLSHIEKSISSKYPWREKWLLRTKTWLFVRQAQCFFPHHTQRIEEVKKCQWKTALFAYNMGILYSCNSQAMCGKKEVVSHISIFWAMLSNAVFHKHCISVTLCTCLNNSIVWVLRISWYESDLWIKLVLHSSFQKKLLWPLLLHFPNGFFTTMTKLNDYLSHLYDLELNLPGANQ